MEIDLDSCEHKGIIYSLDNSLQDVLNISKGFHFGIFNITSYSRNYTQNNRLEIYFSFFNFHQDVPHKTVL